MRPTIGTRRRLRRRRRLTVLVGAVTVAVASAGTLWATGTWPLGGSDPPALAARRSPTTGPTTSSVPACRSPLTSDAPLRLWIGGDSLAGSLGPVLGAMTGNTGIVQPVFDSRVSSGLTSPEFFDWPRHAIQEMARLDPEVVVFIIGTNDSESVRSAATTNGVPDWKTRYTELVTQMLDILGGTGAHRYVYWVGAPTIRDMTVDAGVRQLNDVARTAVQHAANATYVDDYHLFSDSQGHFSFELPDKTGKLVLVRSDDGVHFTPTGAGLLAQAIFGPLDAKCQLLAQAVPGSPKPVIETAGSTQVTPPSRTPTTTRSTPPPSTPPPSTPPPSTSPPTAPPTTRPTLPVPSLPTGSRP